MSFDCLEIRNFQSIRNASMDLGQVNVVTGESNLGKSALCRAIRTLLRNSYDSSMMRLGEKSLFVSLSEGGTCAAFSRKGNKSSYHLGTRELGKAGKAVPPEISEFSGTSLLGLHDSSAKDIELDLNIQSQFDGPFLVSESGYDNARIFGQLTDIDSAVSAQALAMKDIKALKSEITGQEGRRDEAREWLSENEDIPGLAKRLEKIKDLQKSIKEASAMLSAMKRLLGLMEAEQGEMDRLGLLLERIDRILPSGLEKAGTVMDAQEKVLAIGRIAEDDSRLMGFLSRMDKLEEGFSGDVRSIARAWDLSAGASGFLDESERLSELLERIGSCSGLAERIHSLRSRMQDLRDAAESLQAVSCEMDEACKREEALMGSLEGNALCPISGKPISQECLGR